MKPNFVLITIHAPPCPRRTPARFYVNCYYRNNDYNYYQHIELAGEERQPEEIGMHGKRYCWCDFIMELM